MAIRTIRIMGDPILEKVSKEIKHMNYRNRILIEDMIDTMYEQNGVGIAAVQVGVLKRIVILNFGDGPIVLVNPEILESSGEQEGEEGCLSLPGKFGIVKRPKFVKARFFDEEMNEWMIEGEDLAARAICHEIGHLNGEMYVDLVEGELYDAKPLSSSDDTSDEGFESHKKQENSKQEDIENTTLVDEESGEEVKIPYKIYREGEAFNE